MQPVLPSSLDMTSAKVLGFDAQAYIDDTPSTLHRRLNIPGSFNAGDYYVVRPGIYIDANPYLGFDIHLENAENTHTAYAASADFYASQNVVISLQGSLVAPEDDADEYTVGANLKFVF